MDSQPLARTWLGRCGPSQAPRAWPSSRAFRFAAVPISPVRVSSSARRTTPVHNARECRHSSAAFSRIRASGVATALASPGPAVLSADASPRRRGWLATPHGSSYESGSREVARTGVPFRSCNTAALSGLPLARAGRGSSGRICSSRDFGTTQSCTPRLLSAHGRSPRPHPLVADPRAAAAGQDSIAADSARSV